MFKLEGILDSAVLEGHEVILLGYWNTDFSAPRATIADLCPNGFIPQEGLVDVNELWGAFEEGFVSIVDKHGPVIQKRIRGVDNSPFLNNDIRRAMHERDYFLKKARKTGFTEDWSTYRSLRNRVTNTIRRAKESYNRCIIEENSNDNKAFWKTVKKVLPGESMSLSPAIKIRKNVCHDKHYIANMFNRFFVDVV